MNIEKKIIEIINDVIDSDVMQDVNIDSNSDNIEGWDSLSHLQIIIAIESEFKIKFKTSEINELKSIKSLVERVSELINAN